MPQHTTNYYNTLVAVAEDCPTDVAVIPPERPGKKSIANWQYELLIDHPYEFTSDDIFFRIYAIRKEIPENEWPEAREAFFSKGQPCFRSSPLSKRYGWGVHSDANGKVALVACDSHSYSTMKKDPAIDVVKAMRSKRT